MPRKKETPADIIEEKRLEKSDADMDSIFNGMDDSLGRVYDQQEQWEKKTFKGKGALGNIPNWLQEQEYHVNRLSNSRTWLAKRYSLKEIRKMMAEYREHTIKHTTGPLDQAIYGHISVVCFYDDVIAAGPEKGLEMMVGSTTASHIQKHRRIKEGSDKGVEVRFGTQKERDEDRQEYQEAVDKAYQAHPKWSHTALCKEAARQLEVSYKTIYRHTNSPNKK